ncbi:MAG: hypothetical protein QOG16_1266 [Actinomycetota bacterium]|nr:hypothetical protein [Actinomycetota bacterium]
MGYLGPILTRRTFAAILAVVFVAAVFVPEAPVRAAEGVGSGLKLVAEIPFRDGSHMEMATIKGRDYAFVSQVDGLASILHIIDITDPTHPNEVAASPCTGYQGNVQLSYDKKTLVVGIDDDITGNQSAPQTSCPKQAASNAGFITIDISNPKKPRPLAFTDVPGGSHSIATHPTKPFVYSGEGFPEAPGQMTVWSIKDPAKPKLVTTLDTGAHSPHDLAFNSDGSMMATANVVNVHLMDTTDPADPKIVATTQCPGCLHAHEARFTPDSKRLIVNDEYPASPACPGGFMYFYDVTKSGSTYGLDLTGTYTIAERGQTPSGGAPTLCTPHIFDISDDGSRVSAAWHEGGLRYLDISESAGVTSGAEQLVPGGVKELGWYSNPGGDVFSTKLFKGPYLYAVDLYVGFQVFKIES